MAEHRKADAVHRPDIREQSYLMSNNRMLANEGESIYGHSGEPIQRQATVGCRPKSDGRERLLLGSSSLQTRRRQE